MLLLVKHLSTALSLLASGILSLEVPAKISSF